MGAPQGGGRVMGAKVHLLVDGGRLTSEPDPHGAKRRLWRASIEGIGRRSGRRYVGTGDGKAAHVAMSRAGASLADQLRENGDHL